MAFTEHIEYKEEILPNKVIQVRRADVIKKDGVEVGRTYHRNVVVPGQDVSDQPAEVQTIAAALWTPEVIAAYEEQLAANSPRGTNAN
jgi:hypothetical protein|tara:strand:- start:662 stop:925 length:264 start_codon:yes stop_codon:yes gene_type:complete